MTWVVVPEALELLISVDSANRLRVIAEQIAQPELRLRSKVSLTLEDAPAGFLGGEVRGQLRPSCETRRHVHRHGGLIHLGYDVKTVEDVECL